jgi:hypothetical protein
VVKRAIGEADSPVEPSLRSRGLVRYLTCNTSVHPLDLCDLATRHFGLKKGFRHPHHLVGRPKGIALAE